MKKPLLILAVAFSATAGNYTQFVDPFIGTGNVDGGLSGNNYPGATTPFGMVQLSPDNSEAPTWNDASGYHYNNNRIYGFSHTRLSGTGAADLIDITLFPTSTQLRSSLYSHDHESASPGYYSVTLLDENIRAELTATPRVGIQRYQFPADADCNVILDLDHSCVKGDWDRRIISSQIRQVSPTAVAGYRIITGWARLRKVCFYTEFSDTINSIIYYDGGRQETMTNVINGRQLSAIINFGNVDSLVVLTAISPVSIDNARENLLAEAPHTDFDRYVADADLLWDRALSKIRVTLPPEQMTTFYTALYHTMIQPNLFSDVNGQYITADYSVAIKPEGQAEYTTFSLWDTYRAAHPLYTILFPDLTRDFVNSMLDHFDAYGYLPIWQLWGQDNYCMIGNHAIPVIVDAVLKGIEGVDPERAWKAVRESSLNSHPNSPWAIWERYGYMPETIQSQSVSITLEECFDDWCVAQLAKYLGHDADYERFIARSEYYNNLFNPSTGFFGPKDENGNWIEPFDPLKHGANGGNPFTEGNAWQYYWYVPHNIPNLVALTGGPRAFEQKLDTFFSLNESSGERNDNVSGCIGQYAHGNEPSHHVAYLYNYVGRPDKTRSMVSRVMREMYNNTSSGYAGNDDCGEMSAWYVFSALGFYPVNPASGEYDLGIPLVDYAEIDLPNGGTFTIKVNRPHPERPRKSDPTIKRITLDGHPLQTPFLPHSSLTSPSTLTFEMK